MKVPDGSADAPTPGDSPFGAPLPSHKPAESPFASGAAGYEPAGDAENPYQSPSAHSTAPAYAPTQGAFTPTRIDLEDVFSRTWTIFKEQWGACLAAFVVIALINIVLQTPLRIYQEIVFARFTLEGLAILLLGYVILNLITLWITLGQALYFLKIARGQPANLSDLFAGGPYYVRALFAGILGGILIGFGYALLIIPGIILALMFSQYKLLIVDRNVGIIDSLSISKDLMVGNKLTLFLILLVAGVVGSMIVLLTCFTGLLVVGPFMMLLFPVTYLAITGQPTADQIVYGPPAE
ncbi:MAG: hypothetical protein V3R99_06015 [Thermoguttaceae bacterium]